MHLPLRILGAVPAVFLIFLMLNGHSAASQGSYKVSFCPGSKKAKQVLAGYLQTYKNNDPERIKPWLQNWAKEYRLAVAIVELERISDKKLFRWDSKRNNTPKGLVDQQAAVLGTRSIGRPSQKEVSCFFSDTLLIMDTLRLEIGRGLAFKFTANIAGADVALPRDQASGDIHLYPGAFKQLRAGTYHQVAISVNYEGKVQQIGSGTWYLLTEEEKIALRECAANRLDDNKDFDEMVRYALPLMGGIWGGKACTDSETYHQAQAEALESLLNRR